MRVYYTFSVLLFIVSVARGQQDVAVDQLTGRAQLAVPIWKMNSNDVISPIELRYNGGGIKAGAPEGTAGVGWNLSAGGKVTREVRGLPDDYNKTNDPRKGWLTSTKRQAVANFTPTATTNCTDWSAFSTFTSTGLISTTLEDTEPDVFIFNAPGLSGKFVFDNNGTIRLMPYQDVSISYTTDVAGISSIVITTNTGTEYNFSSREMKTRRHYSTAPPTNYLKRAASLYGVYGPLNNEYRGVDYASDWHLTRITGRHGTITYDYTPIESQTETPVRKIKSAFDGVETLYSLFDFGQKWYVSSISASNGTASFRWSEMGMLQSIEIAGSHTFNFTYSNIHDHSFLRSITEHSQCEAFPSHAFTYYTPEVPADSDFFGYCNGEANTSHGDAGISLYTNPSAVDGEKFRIYPKEGYTTLSASTSRAINPSSIIYGSLKRIVYPSKGFTEITYSPNEYYDEATGLNAYGAGIRVSSVTVSDGDADTSNDILRTYEYKKADGTSSGHWLYTPVFAFNDGTSTFYSPDNLAPDETIVYERSTEILNGNGRTEFEYLIPGRYPQTSFSDWTATVTRIVAQPSGSSCPSPGNISTGYYTFPFGVNTNYDFEQGLVSSVKQIDQNGKLVKQMQYTYVRPGSGSDKVTVKGLKLEKVNESGSYYAYGLYSLITNVNKVIQTETTYLFDDVTANLSQSSLTTYAYGNHRLLNQISTTNSDGTLHKTEYRYAKDFQVTNPQGLTEKMLKRLNATKRHGTLVETVQWAGTSVTGAELLLYDSLGAGTAFIKRKLNYGGTGAFQYAALTTGSPQTLNWDPGYFVASTTESYNAAGLPVTLLGLDRRPSTAVYAGDNSTVKVKIENARASEIVTSDFETDGGTQLSLPWSSDAWSGKNSGMLAANTPVSKTSLTKALHSNNYRFRSRIKTTTATNITLTVRLSNTSGGWNTTSITYPAAQSGKWFLVDQLIPVNTVATTFTFELSSTSAFLLDDIFFYPEEASVTSMTFDLFAGKTSETNNNGISAFYEYDALGRITTVKNTDKYIVQSHQYTFVEQSKPAIFAGFSCQGCGNWGNGTYTFTAVTGPAYNPCYTDLSYSWYVNGESAGDGTVLSLDFAVSSDPYIVELQVISASGGSSSSMIEVLVRPQPFSINFSSNRTTITCIDTQVTLTLISLGCFTGVTATWYFKKDGGEWTSIGTTAGSNATISFDCFSQGNVASEVRFKCVATSQCDDPRFSDTITAESGEMIIPRTENQLPCPN